MKKFGKILKRVLLGTLVVVLLFMASVFSFNLIANRIEQKKIEDYGEKIEVFGKNMNVYRTGSGTKTIVMFPGFGTSSPVIDFKPMIEGMKDEYKVVVIEPFGYGLSDATDRERTVANIVEELHEILQKLEIDDFIFMGHSIAGVYGLNYFNTYPNEVKAFIGIDTSVPEQPGAELPLGILKFVRKSGIMRFGTLFSENTLFPNTLTEAEIVQMNLFVMKNSMSDILLAELGLLGENLKSSQSLALPKDLPVYLFLQEFNTGVAGWIPMHEASVKDSEVSKITLIDAHHYLHHTHGEMISELTKEFLTTNLK